MKIRYNAPTTLTFSLVCVVILALDKLLMPNLIESLFTVPSKYGFNFSYLPGYLRLFTHALGHVSWDHLFYNIGFILLLGPMLEEKYGSIPLLVMILITSFVTGFINVLFLDKALLGASGIVFMMILLTSFTNIKNGEIPLTFIFVFILFLAKEIVVSFRNDTISQMAHIAGGICGSLFGFVGVKRRR